MLSSFVGQERFLKGVSIYLKKHLYGNTVTKDLWEGISEATGVDVPRIMDNWISKASMTVQSTCFTLLCLTSDRLPCPYCH
jgi:aminopeptidase 2